MNLSIEVLIALIGIFITVIGQGLYIAFKLGVFEEKLTSLEKKQEKHNSVIERQFKTEADIDVLFEKMEVANHRIYDIEDILNKD